MKIVSQWIVQYMGNWSLLVKTQQGGYFIGYETNMYAFSELTWAEVEVIKNNNKNVD